MRALLWTAGCLAAVVCAASASPQLAAHSQRRLQQSETTSTSSEGGPLTGYVSSINNFFDVGSTVNVNNVPSEDTVSETGDYSAFAFGASSFNTSVIVNVTTGALWSFPARMSGCGALPKRLSTRRRTPAPRGRPAGRPASRYLRAGPHLPPSPPPCLPVRARVPRSLGPRRPVVRRPRGGRLGSGDDRSSRLLVGVCRSRSVGRDRARPRGARVGRGLALARSRAERPGAGSDGGRWPPGGGAGKIRRGGRGGRPRKGARG